MKKPVRSSQSDPPRKPERAEVGTPAQAAVIASHKEIVLLAVTGMSPAVLTETIWALARENPPVIPDEVIVLTTSAGRKAIEDQLFGPDEIWHSLRQSLLGADRAASNRLVFSPEPANVKVLTEVKKGRRVPLAGIDSLEQNNAVADGILDELWAHTEKPGNRLIVSIAGGYKSMSALMMSCLSILGRVQDRVTHVLVDAPYDEPRLGFFFPDQPQQELITRSGETVKPAQAKVRLFDVPWVPFRVLFEKELRQKPASYTKLVAKLREALPEAALEPQYWWEPSIKKGVVTVGDERFILPGRAAALFEFLLHHAQEGRAPFPDHYVIEAPFRDFLASEYSGKPAIKWEETFVREDIKRALEEVRRTMPDILISKRRIVGLHWKPKAGN
jgi:CRISPR-associated protein (TIGR02584 family)